MGRVLSVADFLIPWTKLYIFYFFEGEGSWKHKAHYWCFKHFNCVICVFGEQCWDKPVIFHSVSGLRILTVFLNYHLISISLHFWKCVLGNVMYYLAVLLGLMDLMVCQASLVPGQKYWPLSPLKQTFLQMTQFIWFIHYTVTTPLSSPHLVHWSATLHRDQFVALFVYQQFAVDAFVALSSKTPDTVCADGTVGSLLGRADNEKWENKRTLYYTRQQRGCNRF